MLKNMRKERRLYLKCIGAALCAPFFPRTAGAGKNTPLLRVAVISDLNHSYGTIGYDPPVKAAIKRLLELKPDLVLCTGDMIAGQRLAPKLSRKKLEAMWQGFHNTISNPLRDAGIPFAPSPGNHDASAAPGFQLERDVYQEQWQKSKPDFTLLPGSNYPFNYGFNLNGVLFTSLDATVTGALPTVQKEWLARLLDTQGQTAKSCIVFGHLPLQALAVGRETGILRDAPLEQLFKEQGVTVYLSGHQHAFYPFIHKGQRYVGQAALGSGPRRLIGDKKRSPRSFTLLEIDAGGRVKVNAFTGPAFQQVVLRSTLPPQITCNGITIIRDDLKQ